MKFPRHRVSRLMIPAAIVGLIAAIVLSCRRLEFEHRANIHLDRWFEIEASSGTGDRPARGAYHKAMEAKYRRAARHPWAPVAPDPPEPK